jgi:hypothetical protein
MLVSVFSVLASRSVEARPVGVVAKEGSCPSQQDLVAALRRLLSSAEIGFGAPPSEGVTVEVFDFGDRFDVYIGEVTRSFDDPTRNCAERARAAAVFVALTIEPPKASPPVRAAPPAAATAEPDEPDEGEGEPEPRKPPAPRPKPVPRTAQVDPNSPRAVSLTVDVAPAIMVASHFRPATVPVSLSGSSTIVGGGASARFALGWRFLALAVGFTSTSPFSVEGIATLARSPFDFDLRAILRRGNFDLFGDVGLSVAVLTLSGQGAAFASGATTVDIEARLAATLRYRATTHVGVFATLEVYASRSPEVLVTVPPLSAMPVARTPDVWVGLAIGLSLGTVLNILTR